MKFYFYKGDTSSENFTYEADEKLDKVRKDLITKGFFTETESSDFRFINYQNKGDKYEDMVVGKNTEKYIPLAGMAGINNQIYLTNVNKTKGVDLIGFNTDWWFDRFMSCRMSLNTSDATASATNKGKFPPYMLTNVKTANPNLAGVSMDNVVVCEKGSIVQFDISSWASAGYGFKIASEAGAPINQGDLYVTFSTCPNGGQYATTSLRKYYSNDESINDSTIEVAAINSLPISSSKTLQYMKFTIKTWKVTEFTTKGRTTYSCNKPLPVPTRPVARARGVKALYSNNQGGTPYGSLAGAQSVVPGGTITPGTTVPTGNQSGQQFGGTIHNVKEDTSPNGIIGEVTFYVFVFKNHEDAKATFGKMNDINPSVWGG